MLYILGVCDLPAPEHQLDDDNEQPEILAIDLQDASHTIVSSLGDAKWLVEIGESLNFYLRDCPETSLFT